MLHVLAEDAVAGTELMVANLILRSDSGVVRNDLATLQGPGPIAERVEEAGPDRAASLGGRGGLPVAAWRLARLLHRRDYDIVNAYGLKASVVTRVLVRLLVRGSVFVCGVRGLHVTDVERLDSPKARIASLIERLLSPLVDTYDANSRAALEQLVRLGIGPDRLVHIPNGLDLSLWKPRVGAGESSGAPLIVCAARFAPVKRHADLIEALAMLEREGRGFRAVLAGEGPELMEMRALAARLGLERVVEFPGRIDGEQMRALLDGATVACLPSAFEGMPGALMEAMASGVPVVATDVAGIDELVVGDESGLLVPPYDPPALAAALGSVLDDGELRRRLGAGARRRMEEYFSLEAMLDAKERLYRGLAAGRG